MAGATFSKSKGKRKEYLLELWHNIMYGENGMEEWEEKIREAWDQAKEHHGDDYDEAHEDFVRNELGEDPYDFDGEVDDEDLGIDIDDYINDFVYPVLEEIKEEFDLTEDEFDEFCEGTVQKLLSNW